MTDSKYFNFTNFKSVMDVSDIDETTYAFVLRSVFVYLKQKFNIDLNATNTAVVDVISTTTSLVIPTNQNVLVDQMVTDGTEQVYITDIVQNTILGTTTLTVSPAFTVVPTNITIYTTLIPFDFQYAIYQHAKFLFETQKKNTSIISATTDSTGNKVTYKTTLPANILSIYNEYSPNAVAFI